MLYEIFEKIPRKSQIPLLRKHIEVSCNRIKNRFILYKKIEPLTICKPFYFRNLVYFDVQKNANLELKNHFFMNHFSSRNFLESIKLHDHKVSHTEFNTTLIKAGKRSTKIFQHLQSL